MIKPNTNLDIKDVLAENGYISQALSNFEVRPEQLEMADAVQQAFVKHKHLAIEAGTGVGKSFAYLVPAIDSVCRDSDKTIISTFTITLQEQLIKKDIPLLTGCIPQTFNAVLAKGRNNYLCKRRLAYAMQRQQRFFSEIDSELGDILYWSNQTQDGSLSDLPLLPRNHTWDKVKSEHGNCKGRKCKHFRDCFYWCARRDIEKADIIVANHALLFSDLVLKEQGISILPDYRFVVIDEAHNIEHVAEDHFGINISNSRVKFLLDRLYNPRTRRGLLAYTEYKDTMDLIRRIGRENTHFFNQIKEWYQNTKEETNGRCYKNFVDDNISGHLKKLKQEITKIAKQTEDSDEQMEIGRFVDLCSSLTKDIHNFMNQKFIDHIYWLELDADRTSAVRLKSAPINVGPDVKRCLFEKYDSVILTSATLSVNPAKDKSGFNFFASRIGLDDFDRVKLGSPFDYEKQATMYIEQELPNPNQSDFIEAASQTIKKYVQRTNGKAFVLFTSYSMLEEIARQLTKWFDENNIKLLQQGKGVDRTTLLKKFRAKGHNVLFGTDSFWQGVDVPGEALSNVIIVRLPFTVPDQPLLAGRLDQIRQQGGNPFYDYQLPSAIIKFKQGFGRLVRNKTDTGIIVILDSRILTKSYGKMFLSAIPKCRIEIVTKK